MLKLPGYRVIQKIYSGKRSIIFTGHRIKDQQKVVIKTHKNDTPSQQDLDRLHHEFSLGSHCQAKHIIKYYTFESFRNRTAIIEEDFSGISLAEALPKNGFDNLTFLKLAIQLSDGLYSIHQKNIIHKDISPFNIIINRTLMMLKYFDFSNSTQLKQESNELISFRNAISDLHYISPEQTGRINRNLDYRTDFYSIGITFYEMITGQKPFFSTDPLELIHSHIAKKPTAPYKLKKNIPKVVNDIIMKLLSKKVEERYQSVLGLNHDLQRCLEELKSSNEITTFAIGKKDFTANFSIPQKLYGRGKESKIILNAYKKICDGEKQILMVSGYSGCGKSNLINDVLKPIAIKNVFFIYGKFDQINKNIAYDGITQAFKHLIKQLLTENEQLINFWKEKLQNVLKNNAQVIVDMIPELEFIIGKQQPVVKLNPSESQNRFNMFFSKFIKVFSTVDHPLILFLDDLQWVDSASLNLIKLN